jgi:porin
MRPFAALLPNPKRCMSAKALCLFVTDHYPAALQLNRFTACVKLKRSVHPQKTPKKRLIHA